MSYYKAKYGFSLDQYPNSVEYGNQSISLPVHPKLSGEDIKFICHKIKGAVSRK